MGSCLVFKSFFKPAVYNELKIALNKIGCKKGFNSLKKFWVQDDSVLNIPRTNLIAERAVKILQDVKATCKSYKYLNLKVLNKNSI